MPVQSNQFQSPSVLTWLLSELSGTVVLVKSRQGHFCNNTTTISNNNNNSNANVIKNHTNNNANNANNTEDYEGTHGFEALSIGPAW